MSKTTQPVKIWSLIIGFTFFTLFFTKASTTVYAAPATSEVVNASVSDNIKPDIKNSKNSRSKKRTFVRPSILMGPAPFAIISWQSSPLGIFSVDIFNCSNDTTNPTGTAPADVTVQCSSDIPAVNILSITDEADNCTADPVVSHVGDSSDEKSNPEEITRTYRITDEAGKYFDVSQIITIEDTTPPTANALPQIDVQCKANVPTPDISVVTGEDDNCSTPTVTFVSDVSDGNFNPEVITRTYRITDASGNSVDVEQKIKIEDTTPPSANALAQIDVQCKANVPTPDISVVTGEDDNCSTPTVTFISDDSDGNFNPEMITRTYRITDASGNSVDVEQILNINDTTAPNITAPATVTAPTDAGTCSATSVSLGTPTTSDNCGVKNVTNDVPSVFPLGETVVTWTVTDNAGNTKNATQIVTIKDNQPPVITAGAITEPADVGSCTAFIEMTAAASDNCSLSSLSGVRNDGLDLDAPYPVGKTIITWSASDPSGNHAATVDQEITIEDKEAPVPPNLSSITSGCSFTIARPVATDNCPGTITVTADRSLTFSASGTIKWTFTDQYGNSSTTTQSVTIIPLSTTTESTRTTVYGQHDGTATANPTGGVPPYTYEWRRAGNSQVFQHGQQATNLSAGDYVVTVRDANGCLTTRNVTIIDAVKKGYTSETVCVTVHDYVRTSTLQVDLDEVLGGVGNPANFKYIWNFENSADIVSITPGPDANGQYSGTTTYTIKWQSAGDKNITLTIIDEAKVSKTYDIPHYVGACFEGCGATSNFEMDTTNFFIGDANGNPLTGANCASVTDKYMWIDITNNANGYALSAEMNYAVNDGQTTTTGKAIGCFEKVIGYDQKGDPIYDKINTGLFRLFPVSETGNDVDKINWSCGETFKVEGINIRWTNSEKMGCNEGTKPMCYGPDTEVIVHTPLVIEAEPQNVLCKGEVTGSISIKAAGGLAPYQYTISGPVNRPYQNSNNFYNLPAGTYTYSVKDSRDIITTSSVVVGEPATVLIAEVMVQQPITCHSGKGTAIATNVSGGTPFRDSDGNPYYKYLWNTGETTAEASGLSAGIKYTVTVTDANNCYIIKEITLDQPAQLTKAYAGEDQTLGCGVNSTLLDANHVTVGEKGIWTIVSGNGGSIAGTEINNPKATFSGTPGETYVLQWTISNDDNASTCPNSDSVTITLEQACSTLDFDGLDDYVTFGNNYNYATSDFSLEAWIKPASLTGGTKTIISKRNTVNPSAGGYELSLKDGHLYFRWNGNYVYTQSTLGTDRWYHVAVVFTGSQPKLFVDGIEIALQLAISTASKPNAVSHPFLIGATYYSQNPERPKNHFHGWIEEVRIWKKALSVEQLRFMMNQRLEPNGTFVKGEYLPMNVPGDLAWASLDGYYQLLVNAIDSGSGTTPDAAANKAPGHMKNIKTIQENTAPLPYISANDGEWRNKNTWLRPDYWDPPNSNGINGSSIDWNIVYIPPAPGHKINSGFTDITLLALLQKSGTLDMLGTNPTTLTSSGTGNALTITKYLDINGFIDLNGESQLLQTEGSLLAGSGRLDRDQQGTGSSFNYNYFSSPVSTAGNSSNSGYTLAGILRSGTDPANPKIINFNYQYHYADGPLSDPVKISSYWLNKFFGQAGMYSQWKWIGKDGFLEAGQGFTMKGSSGRLKISDLQNYVMTGMPNNGNIILNIGPDQNHLVGNPYPSAIDADEFIKDNLEGRRGENIFNGSLYFWSHFSGQTHYLERYVGGYATYNLSGGVRAVATDERINATGETGGQAPARYIPVGQAFFVNTVLDDKITNWKSSIPKPVGITGGEIHFKNSQRIYQPEETGNSVFHTQQSNSYQTPGSKPVSKTAAETIKEERKRFWLTFHSPMGYHRQILATEDSESTFGFDIGYDAPLNDNVAEDMCWLINDSEFVIQGASHFSKEENLPLKIKIAKPGEAKIAIEKLQNFPDAFDIYLMDSLTGERHDLRESEFRFSASPGILEGRFSIVFTNDKVEKEAKEESEELQDIKIFYASREDAVTIENPWLIKIHQGILTNISGQHLKSFKIIPTKESVKLSVPLETSGVYILKLETSEGSKALKFIID